MRWVLLTLLAWPILAVAGFAPIPVTAPGFHNEYYINEKKVPASAFMELRKKLKVDRAYREELLENGTVRVHAAKDVGNGRKYEYVQETHDKRVTYTLREMKKRKRALATKSKKKNKVRPKW